MSGENVQSMSILECCAFSQWTQCAVVSHWCMGGFCLSFSLLIPPEWCSTFYRFSFFQWF